MKIRTLLKLALIGGVAYAHKKRGGTWTIASLKESANAFLDAMLKLATPPDAGHATGAERTGTYAESKTRFDDNLH